MQLGKSRPLKAAEVGLLFFHRLELPLRLGVGSVGLGVRVGGVVGSVGPAGSAARPALLVEEELLGLRTATEVPYFVSLGKRCPAT